MTASPGTEESSARWVSVLCEVLGVVTASPGTEESSARWLGVLCEVLSVVTASPGTEESSARWLSVLCEWVNAQFGDYLWLALSVYFLRHVGYGRRP